MLDASVAAAWFVPGQSTLSADVLLDEAPRYGLAAPHLFPVEIRNVFLMAERRGRMDAGDTALAISRLASYAIEIAEPPDTAGYDAILELARAQRLTFYDALYLWQAGQEGHVLASRDSDLLEAAARRGVAIRDLRT